MQKQVFKIDGTEVTLLTGDYEGETIETILVEYKDVSYLDRLLKDNRYEGIWVYINKLYTKYKHVRNIFD